MEKRDIIPSLIWYGVGGVSLRELDGNMVPFEVAGLCPECWVVAAIAQPWESER